MRELHSFLCNLESCVNDNDRDEWRTLGFLSSRFGWNDKESVCYKISHGCFIEPEKMSDDLKKDLEIIVLMVQRECLITGTWFKREERRFLNDNDIAITILDSDGHTYKLEKSSTRYERWIKNKKG